MSNHSPGAPGVSPKRTIISLILAIVLVVVAVMELRASMGHRMTMNKLKAALEAGELSGKTLADIEAMLAMGPSVELLEQTSGEQEYRVSWNSPLGGLARGERALYVITDVSDPPMFRVLQSEYEQLREPVVGESEAGDMAAAMGGGGFGGGGGGGFGGGGGGRPRGPAAGPLEPVLDRDGDGELSAEEIEGAVDALAAADRNGDGVISEDELRPEGQGEGRRRPEMEDDSETPSTETPATETPATETPATETPATETPATETPATETPS
ncbi:MAG: hypothetical protein KDA85_18680, partial [Planctomycetaceae bacterium]|nr:hypothetical protein [Planctomycetaceae bacterium]